MFVFTIMSNLNIYLFINAIGNFMVTYFDKYNHMSFAHLSNNTTFNKVYNNLRNMTYRIYILLLFIFMEEIIFSYDKSLEVNKFPKKYIILFYNLLTQI